MSHSEFEKSIQQNVVIVPSNKIVTNFLNDASDAIASFMRRSFGHLLSMNLEVARKELIQNAELASYFNELLSIPFYETTRSGGIKQCSIEDGIKRNNLLEAIKVYTDKANATDVSIAVKTVKKFVEEMEISKSTSMELSRDQMLMKFISNLSLQNWKDAIMFFAINMDSFSSNKSPIELKVSLMYSLETRDKSSENTAVYMTSFATQVIRQWIDDMTSIDFGNAASSSSSSQQFPRSLPGEGGVSKVKASRNLSYISMLSNLNNLKLLKESLKTSIKIVICKYAKDHVGTNSNGLKMIDLEVEKEQAMITKRSKATDRNSTSPADDELDTSTILKIARKINLYFGYRKQLEMYQRRDTEQKEKRIKQVLEKHLSYMRSENLSISTTLADHVTQQILSQLNTATTSINRPAPNHPIKSPPQTFQQTPPPAQPLTQHMSQYPSEYDPRSGASFPPQTTEEEMRRLTSPYETADPATTAGSSHGYGAANHHSMFPNNGSGNGYGHLQQRENQYRSPPPSQFGSYDRSWQMEAPSQKKHVSFASSSFSDDSTHKANSELNPYAPATFSSAPSMSTPRQYSQQTPPSMAENRDQRYQSKPRENDFTSHTTSPYQQQPHQPSQRIMPAMTHNLSKRPPPPSYSWSADSDTDSDLEKSWSDNSSNGSSNNSNSDDEEWA